MKANTKSLHAKLYKFTYASKLPNSICPYFWKLVLAILLFIPNFLLQLPALIVDYVKDQNNDSDERKSFGGMCWIFLLLVSAFLYTQYHLIKMIFDCYSYHWKSAIVGIGCDITILTIIGCHFFIEWRRNVKYRNSNIEKQPSIISEFIKAKKNKYCPKIDWE